MKLSTTDMPFSISLLFKFPAGVNNTDTLYFQPVATKKNDLKLVHGSGLRVHG